MTGIVSQRRIAFGCVAEPTPRFYDQVLRLVQSIRWFGGSCAEVDIFICFVGEIDSAWRAEYQALGAHIRLVEPFNPHNRFSNKIRFFELPELANYETAMLLDCDMALVQDPAPYIAQPALQLMIADLPTVPTARLAWLCEHFGLVAPAPIYRTTCSQEPTIWYCNTAVMILPTAWIARIMPPWREYILQLCAEPSLLDPPYNHCNQAALALTYIADPLPFVELPVAMNFPLHQTGRRPSPAMLHEDPVILHYHDRIDAAGLLHSVPYPLAQARVEQLNARLRTHGRRQPAATAPQLVEQHAPLPFLIGANFSGVPLLRQLLDRHPGVAMLPETLVVSDLVQACQRAANPAECFVETLFQHERWPALQLDQSRLCAALQALDPFTMSAGLRLLYQHYAARFGKPQAGDVTTADGLPAAQIQQLLPEAHFLHLVRDGRDVVSQARESSAHAQPLAAHAQQWVAEIAINRRHRHELQHYLEVRYEDLLDAPEPTLRRICEYLGLSWDAQLLSMPEQAVQPVGQRAAADQAIIEEQAGDTLAQLGYSVANPQAAPQVVICITGMHRSGTSLVAQILHNCGPYLGPYEQLAAASADNLDGYWEHPAFHQLNDDLLAYFGGGWDLAPNLPAGWVDLPELEPLRQRARELIGQFADQRCWGWKDPRSALVMPFWQQLIPELKVVICVRNPLEVAHSLSRRGMSSTQFGLHLWHVYYQRLLAAIPSEDRIVTRYDAYFTDPAAETQRILDWLGLPSSPALIQRACRVTSADLRHHRNTASNLLDTQIPADVLQLYGQLSDQTHMFDTALLTTTIPTDAESPPVGPAAQLASIIALLRDCETELASLQLVLAAREAEVAYLQPILAARETEIANYARELAALQSTVQARAAEAAYLQPTLAAREAEIANYARELASLHTLLATREAEIANYGRELASLHAILAARETEIANLMGALEVRQAP